MLGVYLVSPRASDPNSSFSRDLIPASDVARRLTTKSLHLSSDSSVEVQDVFSQVSHST